MIRHFTFKRLIIISGACVLLLGMMIPLTAFAQSTSSVASAKGYSFFGSAKLVKPGNHSVHAVLLESSTADKPGYSGIDFNVPAGLTFAGVQTLSTDYDFTINSCGGGSPRFQINIAGVNAFVYIGPPPNYTGCPMNAWTNTGNLATPTSFVDTSQLPGGTFYDTFASADLKYGSDAVTGIQLVADGAFFFPSNPQQDVRVDNIVINSKTYSF
jgi:hypothetical protein